MGDPTFDGWFVRAGAIVLTAAVLYLFVGSLVAAAGVDVPVVSGIVHQNEAEDRQEVAKEKREAREAAVEVLESQR